MILTLIIMMLVGILCCLYLVWKFVPRLFRWMAAGNDSRKSLKRTLTVVGCAAAISLLVFIVRYESNEASQSDDSVAANAPDHAVENPADEKQQPEAEKPKEPTTVSGIARGSGVVPGAIVCPNFELVNMMFRDYSDYWQQAQQDILTHGQYRLLHGEPIKPNFEIFDCALLAPGTSMTVEAGSNVVPVVTATLPDGSTIKGVTMPTMVETK